jgi:hypothetical protein
MSTRATVHFRYMGKTEAIVYRHNDGYPEGLGKDLQYFLEYINIRLKDNRFTDPTYLASKWVVWDSKKYAKDNDLDFLSVGVVMQDPGDINYRYYVDCNPEPYYIARGAPIQDMPVISHVEV